MENSTVSYQYFKRMIAAGEIIDINAFGSLITLLKTDGTKNILISIAGQSFQELPAGISVKLLPGEFFTKLQFQNTEASPVTIEFTLATGNINDNRISASLQQVLENVRDELKGSASGADNAKATVGVAAVVVLAANTSRKAFIVSAPAANTGKIYIGFTSGITTSKGIAELQAGMSLMLDDYQGTVYAISDTAAQSLYNGEW